MERLVHIAAAIDALNRRVGAAVSWLATLMIAIGAFNAVARYVGRFGEVSLASNAWLEAQWYLFSVLFLLGGAWTLERDGHVRVDVLYGRLSARGKAIIDAVGTVVFLLPFCGFALVTSYPAVRNSWSVLEGSPDPGGLPRYPLKTMILLAFGLLLLQGFSQLIKHLATILTPSQAAE